MIIDKVALLLTIIGALNWGGIGLFGFDTVAFLFGGQLALLSRIIYTLVGLPDCGASRCCSVPMKPMERRRTSPELTKKACRKIEFTQKFT